MNITTISAGEHSGSFTITPIDDNILYPDEVNITITDPVNSSSTFLVNPDSENEAPVVGTGTLTVTVIDNDIPEYTVLSNVNTVDEDGGVVVFDISSNVRRGGQSIGFEITETAGVNNIESVNEPLSYEFFYDDFASDMSGWTTAVEWYYSSSVTHSTLYDGTVRFGSLSQRWAYTETPITHANSGTQTNRIRINIPHISDNNSQLYVEILKDGQSIQNSGWIDLDGTETTYSSITANGDGSYSGYVEVEYTDDVDLNSTYEINIEQHQSYDRNYVWAYVYIGDINIYNVTQGNLGILGTITPSAVDGSSALVVTMKNDSVVYDENTFDITFSESESEFKLDTDSDFTLNQVTKTININEQG